MAIWDDIESVDGVIRHYSAGATIYTDNALYSWIQAEYSTLARLAENIPMSAQTPSDYTVGLTSGVATIAGFIDRDTTKFLTAGAIKSSDWTHPTNTRGYRLLTFGATYVNCVTSDLHKPIVGGSTTDSGVLVHYDNTAKQWYVRCDAADDLFDAAEAITITGGTGSGTTTGASVTGEEIFANIYTLGSLAPGSSIYLIQNGSKVTAWWSAGNIDILVQVKRAGSLIDAGKLTVYCRKWGASFHHYEIDVSGGSRNPISVSTALDTNNTTAVATVGNYAQDIRVHFVNGTLNYDGGSGTGLATEKVVWDQTSNATAFLLSVGAAASGAFTLANVDGTFGNNNALSILAELPFKTQTGAFTVGQVVTQAVSGATGTIRRVIQDPQLVGTSGMLYLSGVVGSFDATHALSDPVTGAAVADGAIVDAPSWAALVDGSMASAHTMDRDLSNGSGLKPYAVHINCGTLGVQEAYEFASKFLPRETSTWQMHRVVSGVVTPIDGEQYRAAYTGYTEEARAPFGTKPGTVFLGAQGVYLYNMAADDINNYQLIDANGDLQVPPNRQDVEVTALEVGDAVSVFNRSGGDINKNMFGGIVSTPIGSDYLDVVSSIPSDTPTTGTLRIVDGSLGEEVVYTYSGYTGSRFTGVSPVLADTYASPDDTVYAPYIYAIAVASSIAVPIIQTVVRDVRVVVRQYGFDEFTIDTQITATGMHVAAIRTVDPIPA